MNRTWMVWCNAWKTGEWPGDRMTYRVTVTARDGNQALKKGNKKLGIPKSRREKLHIFEAPHDAVKGPPGAWSL